MKKARKEKTPAAVEIRKLKLMIGDSESDLQHYREIADVQAMRIRRQNRTIQMHERYLRVIEGVLGTKDDPVAIDAPSGEEAPF